MNYHSFSDGELIYKNPLSQKTDISDWIQEGEIEICELEGKLVFSHQRDALEYGDHAHWVLWCPEGFPDQIIIEWEFTPLSEHGLCMLFLAAKGRNGEDIMADVLPKRTGYYPQYHSGSLNTLHLSYYRRKHREERAFRTCNLRKSYGFHLVAQGADPLPAASDSESYYRMRVVKYNEIVQFSINGLPVLEWKDNGQNYGPIYTNGKVGFRQMAPMKAAYANFTVKKAILETSASFK